MPMCCVVPECDDPRKKKKEGVVSYHRFPKSDRRELCQQWLRAIKNPRYDENTDPDVLLALRVCSDHFTADDFNRNIMAELMDEGKRRKPKALLKDDAVPSVFPQPEASTSLPLVKRRTTEDLQVSMERGCSNPKLTPTASAADLTLAKSRKEFVAGTPSTSTPGTASRHGLHMLRQSALMDTSSSSGEVLDLKVPASIPEDDSSATATPVLSQEEVKVNGWQEPKVIVYESRIKELFRMCQHCGKPINETHMTYVRAQMKVRWDCLGGHSGIWTSSPEMSAASVLFTGSTITELVDWVAPNQQMTQPTTFYDMQKSYFGPAIEKQYAAQRHEIPASVEEEDRKDGPGSSKPIHLSGDGRPVCVESRLQVKMNSPDSDRDVSIKREPEDVSIKQEPEDHALNILQVVVCKDEVPTEQERSPSLLQEEPEPPHNKDEQEELKEEQDGLLQRPEEPVGLTLTLLAVKGEEENDDDDEEQDISSHCSEVEVELESDSEVTEDGDDWEATSEDGDDEQRDKSFSESGSLRTRQGINTRDKPFHCKHCKKSFTRSTALKRHKCVHTGEKPFLCTFCGKSFSISSKLKGHQLIHTGEKPFYCEHCNEAFSRSSDMKTHQRIHTGEKPFHCEHCNKSFGDQSNLRVHIVCFHTREKPFYCEHCENSFTDSSSLKRHLRVHPGEKPFKCKHCEKSFRDPSTLRQHFLVHT